MEISHRSDVFEEVLNNARNLIRELLNVPENYEILFMHGGASMQFSMIPMNFLPHGAAADYVITGVWGKKALKEARRCGNVRAIFDSEPSGFTNTPSQAELNFDPNARYIHYTSNETIEGVEFKYDLDGAGIPVICDASSNIFSKPIDVSKYSLIYAGAQKNIGPSGLCVVIISREMLERVPENQHSQLDYKLIAKNDSMLNTPNTWGIYLTGLVMEWLKNIGGVPAIEKINQEKASIIYDSIDRSEGFFNGHADREFRSLMNVTFRLPSEDLTEKFASEAEKNGMSGLRGHRSVGGIRASIYNAFPLDGAKALADFMDDFSAKNG